MIVIDYDFQFFLSCIERIIDCVLTKSCIFQFFLSCIKEVQGVDYFINELIFQFFLSCIKTPLCNLQRVAEGHPFNSFLVASELFYSGGVYMFNV